MMRRPLLCGLSFLLSYSASYAQPPASCIDYEQYPHWAGGSSVKSENVVASEWYLYEAGFGSLSVLDLHSPEDPRTVGTVFTGHRLCRVAVAGPLGYVAGRDWQGNGSLKVISLSTPTDPTIIGSVSIAGAPCNVDVEGSHAFVVTTSQTGPGSTLQVVDISNSVAPAVVGTIAWSAGWDEEYMGLSVSGSRAYVTIGNILLLIDVTIPNQPAVIGGMQLSGNARGLTVAGTRVFAACELDTPLDGSTFEIIDASNPTNPVVERHLDVAGTARDVQIVGSAAYLVLGGYGGRKLMVLDVSTPSSPEVTVDIPTWPFPVGVAVAGMHAYVAANLSEDPGDASTGLQVINLPTFNRPPVVGMVPNKSGPIAVQGSHAYLAGSAAVDVVDVSNPALPVAVQSFALPELKSCIAVSGAHAYVATFTGFDHVVRVLNLSSSGLILGPKDEAMTSPAHDIVADGSYAYVATEFGLEVIHIEGDGDVNRIAGLNTGPATTVALIGAHACLTTLSDIHIVDVSSPASPDIVWTEGFESNPKLSVSDHWMYVTYSHDGETFLVHFDVSTPASPQSNGYLRLVGPNDWVVAAGPYAYTSGQIVDISAPGRPRFVGNMNPVGARPVISGSFAYVSADGNFYVLPAHCPDNAVGVADTPSAPLSVAAYPNPFNPTATIEYVLPSRGFVNVAIYDTRGERVTTLANHEAQDRGTHTVYWNGQTNRGVVASGVYFVRIEHDGGVVTKKVTLLK